MTSFNIINTVVIYVESHIEDELPVDSLVELTGYSLAHIRDVFKKHMNISINQYISYRKVARAAFEIIRSDLKLIEIASSFGFDSYDTFTRVFKRYTGMTPSQFRETPLKMEIGYVSSSIFAPVFHKNHHVNDSKGRAPVVVKQPVISEVDTHVIFGIRGVDFGFGLKSTFAACADALFRFYNVDIGYDALMVMSGCAFRLCWNTTRLDLGNINIMNYCEDPYDPFKMVLEAMHAEYHIFERNGRADKEAFKRFIIKEISSGRPCLGIGIIGPPEVCLITGYRDHGDTLLGYSLFQNEPQFCKNTQVEASGFFACSDWWENPETRCLISVDVSNAIIPDKNQYLKVAKRVLAIKKVRDYACGSAAYQAISDFLLNESLWDEKRLLSLKFEQLIAFGDVLVMLLQRKSASQYYRSYGDAIEQEPLLRKAIEIFERVADIPVTVDRLIGGWCLSERLVEKFSDTVLRTKIAKQIEYGRKLEEQLLEFL